MWFTRVSLKNPVFATMLMLALVVLGAFSYQRLQVARDRRKRSHQEGRGRRQLDRRHQRPHLAQL
jgi:hypothetical protein